MTLRQAWPGAALAGAALAVASLTACSSGHAVNTGPLGDGYSHGAICGWVKGANGVATYGVEELRNAGKSTAVVERVALTSPKNLIIVRAWVIPVNGPDLLGSYQGWPTTHLDSSVKWPQRVNAAGARIPPAHGQHSATLVLLLKPTAHKGTATANDVYYRESGQQYHLRFNTSVEFRTTNSC
jgi:hypothetical protein